MLKAYMGREVVFIVYICEVCLEEAEAVYFDFYKEVIGCDRCVTLRDAGQVLDSREEKELLDAADRLYEQERDFRILG